MRDEKNEEKEDEKEETTGNELKSYYNEYAF